MTKEEIQTKREYEMFLDDNYYGLRCVRDKSDRGFNSRTSRHFIKKEDALKFLELLYEAK